MTKAEAKFKNLVRGLHFSGVFPSPQKINRAMGKVTRGERSDWKGTLYNINNLCGQDADWRVEVFLELGYTKHPRTGRWTL